LGSSTNRRAMKVRQAERFLKRMRKYSVEEKALKMKTRKKEHACTIEYFEARFVELEADRRAAEIFVLGFTSSNEVHGKLLRICSLAKSIF